MKIVLDTNILVSSISSRSQYHPIYQALIDEKYDLYISNEILLEYEEIIKQKYSPFVAQIFLDLMEESDNIHKQDVFYRWQLIQNDLDDNKFIDLAIAVGADYLVSEDTHFNLLKKIPFPKIEVIGIQEMMQLIQNL